MRKIQAVLTDAMTATEKGGKALALKTLGPEAKPQISVGKPDLGWHIYNHRVGESEMDRPAHPGQST